MIPFITYLQDLIHPHSDGGGQCETVVLAGAADTWQQLVLAVGRKFGENYREDDSDAGASALEKRFIEITSRYEAVITRLCFNYATEKYSLDDLRQDCLINIWRGLEDFREDCSLTTWIYRVVINTCITSFRSQKNRMKTESIDSALRRADQDAEPSENEVLQEMLSRLPLLDRGVIMMWLDDRSYDEIAEVTGISKSNVGVRLHRIREKMKSMAEKSKK